MSWREQLDVGELTVSSIIIKDPSESGETVFLDVQADDLETALQVSGDVTTGLNLTGAMTDGIAISGVTTGDGIDISGIEGGGKAIRMGSYSSRLDTAGATTEVCTIGAETDEDDFLIGYGSYIRTSGEDGKGFGASFLVEATNTTGTPTLQGMQCMAFLGSVGGSEAAVLKTMGGDATAGMYAAWFKIGSNTNCVCDSGSRVAVLWVDSQMGNVLSGEEYSIFITTGGSRPDAVFGFETTSSGHDYLFLWDETYTAGSTRPLNGGAVDTDGGDSDGSIKCKIGSTEVLIPYFNA